MKKMSKTIVIFMLGVIASFAINVAAEAVISSGAVSYSNTTVSAALDELFSAVDINNKIGTKDISTIGDGTITGAISILDKNIQSIYNSISELNSKLIKKITISGTTTESGALAIDIDTTKYDIVSARVTSNVNVFALPRNDEYLMCFTMVNTDFLTYGNSPVIVDVWYAEK